MNTGQKVRAAFTVLAAVLTLLFGAILGVDAIALPHKRAFNAAYQQLRSEVKRELPPGSSLEQIDRFLQQRRIEYSYSPAQNAIVGSSQTKYDNVLSHCRIQLVFRLGADRLLREPDVYKVCSYL